MCTLHSDPPVHRYHSDPPMLNQRRYYTHTLHCLPVKLLYVCVNNCALQYWYDSTYSFTVRTDLLCIQFCCAAELSTPVYCERWPWQCYTHAGVIDSSLLYTTMSSWLNKLILLLLIRNSLFWLCITTAKISSAEYTWPMQFSWEDTSWAQCIQGLVDWLYSNILGQFSSVQCTSVQSVHWRIGWLTAQLVSPVVQSGWTANSTPNESTTSIIIRLAKSYCPNESTSPSQHLLSYVRSLGKIILAQHLPFTKSLRAFCALTLILYHNTWQLIQVKIFGFSLWIFCLPGQRGWVLLFSSLIKIVITEATSGIAFA